MQITHSTLAPLLKSKVIVCHPLFEGEGRLSYSEAFGKYFVSIGDDAMVSFKLGNVKRVTCGGKNKDIFLQGAEESDLKEVFDLPSRSRD